jgi:hypothetical protein
MKRSDLRSGMVVVTRDGDKGIVLLGTSKGNIIGGVGNSTSGLWKPLDGLNDDLEGMTSTTGDDIIAVYDGTSNMHYGSTNLDNLRLIWERPADPIVLTIDEIAEKFGVDPSLIQIKKD